MADTNEERLSIAGAAIIQQRAEIERLESELSACREREGRMREALDHASIVLRDAEDGSGNGGFTFRERRWRALQKSDAALASCAPPHSDGIGGVCLGCEDCNPGAPNSRRRPLAVESKEEAQEYSKQAGIKVWAKIWSWTGVFEIYPGGKSVWNKNW